MSYKDWRIVFMGTPEFAVASLDALLKAEANIVAVITAPDKPGGRGMELQQSAVKKYAVANNIPVLQPEKLKNEDFLTELESFNADLQIVVAFRMLPEFVWNMPANGTINLHGSLLPHYRGAAPINWAVINGEKETGVTTFLLQQRIDTGNVLLQETIPIAREDNVGIVHDRMMLVGAKLLVKTIDAYAKGELQPKPQENFGIEEAQIKHAPKIHTADCKINWEKTAEENYNFIRGLSPYPAAFTELHGKKLKIFSAIVAEQTERLTNGAASTDSKTFLSFQCIDAALHITELQLEGKKRMPVEDFLRGYKWP